MNNQKTFFRFVILILILTGVLVGLTIANYQYATRNSGGSEFLARWMGARYWVVEGISPYDEQVSTAIQREVYGHRAKPERGEELLQFIYPLHSMVFFAPFSLMEYLPARALWMTLLEISLFALAAISVRLVQWRVSWLRLAFLALFTLFWYFGARTMITGQFAALNAMLIALALLLIRQKQDILAGVLLALSTAKPQMSLLIIPFVFLWAYSKGRRDIIGGTLVSLLFILGVSLVFLPSWPLQMAQQYVAYMDMPQMGSPVSLIATAMPGISQPVNWFLHGITVLYLLVEWVLAWGKDERWFLWTAMITLVITSMLIFRNAASNYIMLLPALFLVLKVWEERWGAVGKWLQAFAFVALGFGSWALFLFLAQGNPQRVWVYLPLPFFVLVSLWWVRWWAVRPPRVLMDRLNEQLE